MTVDMEAMVEMDIRAVLLAAQAGQEVREVRGLLKLEVKEMMA